MKRVRREELGRAVPTPKAEPAPLPLHPEMLDASTLSPPQPPTRYMPHVRDNPMTAKELASFLKVSPATIRRMFHKGMLPYFRVNKRVRFLPGHVLQKLNDDTKH
jgi:excisionase family DNA binding protein